MPPLSLSGGAAEKHASEPVHTQHPVHHVEGLDAGTCSSGAAGTVQIWAP